MPNFQAKTKEELSQTEQPKPGLKTPSADFNGLRPLGASEFFPRHWQYRNKEHTLENLKIPGYFCGEARNHLNPGDEIHYTLEGGKKLPSEWERGIAVVEANPNSKELPLILAGYVRYGQPTSWDGKAKVA